jgi:hypothetical protein
MALIRDPAEPDVMRRAPRALVLIHPFQAMHCRSEQVGWWRLPPTRLVWGSLATLVLLQWLTVSWGPLARLLGTAPLSAADWLVSAVAVVWPVVLMELVKGWGRRAPLGHVHPTPT